MMKPLKKSYLSLALAFTATAPLALPSQSAGLFKSLSEQEEIQAGQQVAAQAQKEYGRALPANDPMSRRVRAIGMQFARMSKRTNIPYSYTVLQNDKVLNAFAAPGGPIFVTTKLVRTASNDAELAYVLGHETGHIDRKHIVKAIEKQQKQGAGLGILGAILSRGRGGQAANVGVGLLNAVLTQKYSRGDENESDRTGIRWMSRLGYDPRAAITMLAKLDEGGGGGTPQFLASHPAPGARQKTVQTLIQQDNLLEVARQAGGPRLSFSGSASEGFNATSYPNNSNYPDNGNDVGYDAPDDASYDAQNGSELNWGAPLQTRVSGKGDVAVVMAPVNGFARWAGATVSRSGNVSILRRGNSTLELRPQLDGRGLEWSFDHHVGIGNRHQRHILRAARTAGAGNGRTGDARSERGRRALEPWQSAKRFRPTAARLNADFIQVKSPVLF
jgi:Zn-dependent protease with chaperone function